MKRKLTPNLQQIYDLELTLGNTVIRVDDSGHAALPLTIVFEQPLHRTEIEHRISIVSPVRWYVVGGFAGYVSEDCRQSLQGPSQAIGVIAENARQRLSMHLQAIYDLEVKLGNSLVGIDEPAGPVGSLALTFKMPLHKSEIESSLSLPSSVEWWESRDPHYPIEGGYGCRQTGQSIGGPLR